MEQGQIEGRTEEGEYSDLLSLLISSQKQPGSNVSDDLIVDEAITFLLAGFDTTGTTLAWVMYYLARHPEIQKKAQEEVDELLRGEILHAEDLNNLTYLKKVINETLRITPVTNWIPKLCSKEVEICGRKFDKGTLFYLNFFGVHHDPKIWGDPENFRPERWDDPDILNKHPFSFVPFSASSRNCIGQRYAIQEMLITLSMLLQKYDLQLNTEKKVIGMLALAITPKNLEIKFIPRQHKN